MSNNTISFEMSRDLDGNPILVSVNMPEVAVMSVERYRRLFTLYGQFISLYTHTDSGRPEITFLLSDGEWRYEISSSPTRFVFMKLIEYKEARK